VLELLLLLLRSLLQEISPFCVDFFCVDVFFGIFFTTYGFRQLSFLPARTQMGTGWDRESQFGFFVCLSHRWRLACDG